MKFNVPTNWQSDLLPSFKHFDIAQVYGKLQEDFVGGGRPSFMLPYVSRKKAGEHIALVKSLGLNFNYLLNSIYMDNDEFTKSGQRRLRRLLDWLTEVGVVHVTVAIPFLVHFLKKFCPHFHITVSSLALINSAAKAKYWDSLGVDEIVLWDTECNRDFQLLKEIRSGVKCKIQLIANNACLNHCPFRMSHYLQTCYLSRRNARKVFHADYYHLMCQLRRLDDPVEIIKSQWIRPEDIEYYDAAGVDTIKLVDRRLSTERLKKIIEAYANRRYKGNLIDLFPCLESSPIRIKIPAGFRKLCEFCFGWIKRTQRLQKVYDFSYNIFLDNEKLDGFLEFFVSGKCDNALCASCAHCKKFAEQALSFEEKHIKELKNKYALKIDQILKNRIEYL